MFKMWVKSTIHEPPIDYLIPLSFLSVKGCGYWCIYQNHEPIRVRSHLKA